jgi:threonine synthase
VCVLTGHGLKDPDVVQADEGSLTPIPADLGSIRNALEL